MARKLANADIRAVRDRLKESVADLDLLKYGEGVHGEIGRMWVDVSVHFPSNSLRSPELDIEVAIGVVGGPEHALVYLSTWQWAHGGLRRYRPSDKGWPMLVNEDFERLALPEMRKWRDVDDVVDALLEQRIPPDRGLPLADHAKAAWRLSTAAGLESEYERRAIAMLEEQEWSDDIADELEWFSANFGMPIAVRRKPATWRQRLRRR